MASKDNLLAAVRGFEEANENQVRAREALHVAVRKAAEDGMAKMEIHRLTGYSRPTIDKILSET